MVHGNTEYIQRRGNAILLYGNIEGHNHNSSRHTYEYADGRVLTECNLFSYFFSRTSSHLDVDRPDRLQPKRLRTEYITDTRKAVLFEFVLDVLVCTCDCHPLLVVFQPASVQADWCSLFVESEDRLRWTMTTVKDSCEGYRTSCLAVAAVPIYFRACGLCSPFFSKYAYQLNRCCACLPMALSSLLGTRGSFPLAISGALNLEGAVVAR